MGFILNFIIDLFFNYFEYSIFNFFTLRIKIFDFIKLITINAKYFYDIKYKKIFFIKGFIVWLRFYKGYSILIVNRKLD